MFAHAHTKKKWFIPCYFLLRHPIHHYWFIRYSHLSILAFFPFVLRKPVHAPKKKQIFMQISKKSNRQRIFLFWIFRIFIPLFFTSPFTCIYSTWSNHILFYLLNTHALQSYFSLLFQFVVVVFFQMKWRKEAAAPNPSHS